MVLLDHVWDDVMAGPRPDSGLGKLRKELSTKPLNMKESSSSSSSSKYSRSVSMLATPPTPGTPSTPSPTARKDNVWRSVFNPGSNIANKGRGAELFDKPQPNSPTVYDWLYSGESRSKHV